MKTLGKHRTKVDIVSDGTPMSSTDYSKIRRVVTMLEFNNFDVVLKGFVVNNGLELKEAV